MKEVVGSIPTRSTNSRRQCLPERSPVELSDDHEACTGPVLRSEFEMSTRNCTARIEADDCSNRGW